MLYRRSTFALYCLHDAPTEATPESEVFAFSALTGRPEPLTPEDLRRLQRLPANRWIQADELRATFPDAVPETWLQLARQGLVLVKGSGQPRIEELLRRHERLDADAWNGLAATYHFMGRWQDAHIGSEQAEDTQTLVNGVLDAESSAAFLARHGQAPPHFHTAANAGRSYPMPDVRCQGGLWETLGKRRTTRAFDPSKEVSQADLATVLRYAFGCHGIAPMFDGVAGIKKTSPSGGGLHPIEIYPLVLNAGGLAPGLYHYQVAGHRMDQIEKLTSQQARALANELTAGQQYTARAGVLFLMTARFFRNFWKYRRHDKAYGVLLMDAAHLSQTFYLVCAELGLGAFFTAAVNGRNIERRLGLDGYREGALAVCGCGHAGEGSGELEPQFRPCLKDAECPSRRCSPPHRSTRASPERGTRKSSPKEIAIPRARRPS